MSFPMKGRLEYSIEAVDADNSSLSVLDQVRLSCQTTWEGWERDSGGNTTLKVNFGSVTLERGPGYSIVLNPDGQKVSGWSHSRKINHFGKRISTLMEAAAGAARAAKTQQQHHQKRAQQLQERAERGLGYYYGEEEELEEEIPPPDPLEHLGQSQINILNPGLLFLYPEDRVRPGSKWSQPINWSIFSPHLTLQIQQNDLAFELVGFERQGNNFFSVIEWNWSLSPKITNIIESLKPFLSGATTQGTFKGRAWVGYKNGMVDQAKGNLIFLFFLPKRTQPT